MSHWPVGVYHNDVMFKKTSKFKYLILNPGLKNKCSYPFVLYLSYSILLNLPSCWMVCTAIKQMSSPATRTAISLFSLYRRVFKGFLSLSLSVLLLFRKCRSFPSVKFAVLHLCGHSATVELITMCSQLSFPLVYVGHFCVCTVQWAHFLSRLENWIPFCLHQSLPTDSLEWEDTA